MRTRTAFSVNGWLLAAGAFALVWVIARANLQSVTIDEADSYLGYVSLDWPSHFYPTSGNHVLLSILDRILIGLFGLSHLTLRGPSLIGAVIYIAAMYGFCTLLRETKPFQLLLFICLVYNPFILDYLVAARGYSLALAFLSLTVLILARQLFALDRVNPSTLYQSCVAASVCAGFSFAANFGFAFVNASALAIFAIWAGISLLTIAPDARQRRRDLAKLAMACVLPGLLVAFLVCGATVVDWPLKQPYFGSRSLLDTWNGLVESSFFEVNDFIAHPLLRSVLEYIQPVLPYVFAGLLLAQLIFVAARVHSFQDRTTRALTLIEGFLVSALILSLSLHWLAFHLFRILLPKERAAIYVVTLAVLALGVGGAICSRLKSGYLLRVATMTLMFTGAIYFICCMRLSYFKEWKFGAEVRSVYPILERAERCYGIHDVYVEWMYRSSLHFYQHYYGNQDLKIYDRSSLFHLTKTSTCWAIPLTRNSSGNRA